MLNISLSKLTFLDVLDGFFELEVLPSGENQRIFDNFSSSNFNQVDFALHGPVDFSFLPSTFLTYGVNLDDSPPLQNDEPEPLPTGWVLRPDGDYEIDTGSGPIILPAEAYNDGWSWNDWVDDDVRDMDTSDNAYHEYLTVTSLGITPEQMSYQQVLFYLENYGASPGTTAGVKIGNTTFDFAGVGFVRRYTLDDGTIVNVTIGGAHSLDPGVVNRFVVLQDGYWAIRTIGNGTGILPEFNERAAEIVWELLDYAVLGTIIADSGIKPAGPIGANSGGNCFLAGTKISLPTQSVKNIEDIEVGDMVMSYGPNGDLVTGKVTQLFRNRVNCVLDIHGLMVTPGHVTYCADGHFVGQHVPIIDIIMSDGALMRENGEHVRAATNETVGSKLDQFVQLSCAENIESAQKGCFSRARVRLGTKVIGPNGDDISFWEMLTRNGFDYDADTEQIISPTGELSPMKFLGSPPKPEDYILAKSGLSLAEIYNAGEWREDHVAPNGAFGVSVSAAQN